MIKFDKHNRVSIRVKPGSALERFLRASPCRTATDALHELAVEADPSRTFPKRKTESV